VNFIYKIIIIVFCLITDPAYVAPSKNVQLPSYKDYLSLSNYNTAPRGWKQGDTIFYRPVTFNNQPNREDTRRKSFTDF